jgi:alginate O-acetyltransferase complex protein AlgI
MFKSLSYTIDVYKKRTSAVRSLEDYALFVMFFPVLVAGPIERAGHMMPKLTTPRILSIDQTTRGVFLVLMGLFEKVAIADGLAVAVNSVYASTGTPTWADVVAATVLFAFQIYCDFSGCTDIARGVGKIMGFDLLLNFNLPYFSRGPSEFWQR